MGTTGIVRFWLDADGWGVIDSDQTPGGCWAHFSVIAVAGYRALTPGQQVQLEWEAADQDGYAFRATRTWPSGQEPIQDSAAHAPDGIYNSTLTITFDDE
ncbi:MAG: hypothetical protein WBX27_05975 [Specibacter sp.]